MVATVDYDYEFLSKWFSISENSPSGLEWASDVMHGKNCKQVKKMIGKPAGQKYYNKKSGLPLAWRVQVNNKRYQVHRVIWVLLHNEISNKHVIDHLDQNPFNNKVDNLSLKTTRENNQNVSMSSKNTSGKVGVQFLEDKRNYNRSSWAAVWRNVDGKSKRRCFSINKFGYEQAKQLAYDFRDKKIEELNDSGMKYTELHGSVSDRSSQ